MVTFPILVYISFKSSVRFWIAKCDLQHLTTSLHIKIFKISGTENDNLLRVSVWVSQNGGTQFWTPMFLIFSLIQNVHLTVSELENPWTQWRFLEGKIICFNGHGFHSHVKWPEMPENDPVIVRWWSTSEWQEMQQLEIRWAQRVSVVSTQGSPGPRESFWIPRVNQLFRLGRFQLQTVNVYQRVPSQGLPSSGKQKTYPLVY